MPRTSSSAPPTAACAAATASAPSPPSCCTRRTCPSCSPPRARGGSIPATGITRITAAIGTRPGADALLEEAVSLASATGAELRLLSLVSVDLPASVDTGVIRIAGAAHADDVLAQALAALPEGIEAEVVVGRGESIEDAVSHLSWEPGEIAVVGSSRLAQPRRLFLGSTAAKMLHELPVPMIVVPRTDPRKRRRQTSRKRRSDERHPGTHCDARVADR